MWIFNQYPLQCGRRLRCDKTAVAVSQITGLLYIWTFFPTFVLRYKNVTIDCVSSITPAMPFQLVDVALSSFSNFLHTLSLVLQHCICCSFLIIMTSRITETLKNESHFLLLIWYRLCSAVFSDKGAVGNCHMSSSMRFLTKNTDEHHVLWQH